MYTLAHHCLFLRLDTGISRPLRTVALRMYGYVSALAGRPLARPFASILNRATPLGLRCLAGAPAKRMQMSMSTMVPTAAHSQPKTEDEAAAPFIRNP